MRLCKPAGTAALTATTAAALHHCCTVWVRLHGQPLCNCTLHLHAAFLGAGQAAAVAARQQAATPAGAADNAVTFQGRRSANQLVCAADSRLACIFAGILRCSGGAAGQGRQVAWVTAVSTQLCPEIRSGAGILAQRPLPPSHLAKSAKSNKGTRRAGRIAVLTAEGGRLGGSGRGCVQVVCVQVAGSSALFDTVRWRKGEFIALQPAACPASWPVHCSAAHSWQCGSQKRAISVGY